MSVKQSAEIRARTNRRALLHRLFLVLFLLLQLTVLIVPPLYFQQWARGLEAVFRFISLCIVLYIVREENDSSYKVPWIIFNLVFPVLGGLMYLMFGHIRFTKSEKQRMKSADFRRARTMFDRKDRREELRLSYPRFSPQSEYIRSVSASPVYGGTQVQYFSDGESMFGEMLQRLEQAEHSILIETFIIHPGILWAKVESILIRKAEQGVDCRLIYDDFGCMGLIPTDLREQLAAHGVRAVAFNRLTNMLTPRFNNRDHRKICVVDGTVAFTGGANFADEYINAVERFGHWKDGGIMLKGEGVRSLTSLFLWQWEFATGEPAADRLLLLPPKEAAEGYVQPFGDSPLDDEFVGEMAYRNLICGARDYVWFTTPYLIIDTEMIRALTVAARSGVDVRIVTPGIPDKKLTYLLTRSYYDVLLRAGVRIWEYTPGFIHTKQCVSDDLVSIVGTINLDYRSFCHHFECAVWMCGTPAVTEVRDDIRSVIAQSREVTLQATGRHTLLYRVCLAILRVFAPLF